MRKLITAWVIGINLTVGAAYAKEIVTLSSSYMVNPTSATVFDVRKLILDRDTQRIYITITSNNNVAQLFEYTGSTATALMNTLNKANLSTTSLNKRILNQLILDGYLNGAVSGSPD